MAKCRECNGCCDLVYFGANRFWYCDFCMLWYGGMDTSLYVVPQPEMDKFFLEFGLLSNTKLSGDPEINSDKSEISITQKEEDVKE